LEKKRTLASVFLSRLDKKGGNLPQREGKCNEAQPRAAKGCAGGKLCPRGISAEGGERETLSLGGREERGVPVPAEPFWLIKEEGYLR